MQGCKEHEGRLNILRFPEVVRKTGISRTGVYEKIRAGTFPEPILLGARAVGFVESEVDDFIESLIKNSRFSTKDGLRADMSVQDLGQNAQGAKPIYSLQGKYK